jgi:hypothetical protein
LKKTTLGSFYFFLFQSIYKKETNNCTEGDEKKEKRKKWGHIRHIRNNLRNVMLIQASLVKLANAFGCKGMTVLFISLSYSSPPGDTFPKVSFKKSTRFSELYKFRAILRVSLFDPILEIYFA